MPSFNFSGIDVKATIDAAEDSCELSPFFNQTEPLASGYTYHGIILVISAVAGTLCLILSVSLASVHLSNWVKPKEQKQLVRIIIFPPISAAFSLFSVWFYDVSWLLDPFPQLYECFALVAMFYLLVLYVAPYETHWDDFFMNLQRFGVVTNKPTHDRGSLRWFKLTWVMVFQILPVKLALNLAIWISGSLVCPLKYKLSREATALSIIESVATSICVLAIVWFARRMAPDLVRHAVVYKLFSFKGIVGVTLTQAPVFQLFAQHDWFRRTPTVSVLDFAVGTPAFMTCVEMFFVSVVFLWSFSAEQYLELSTQLPRTKGLGGAVLDVLDARDILRGLWYMCQILWCGGCGGRGRGVGRQKQKRVSDKEEDLERESNNDKVEMTSGRRSS